MKLALWHRLLRLRAEHPDALAAGHEPLPLDHHAAPAVLAHLRGDDVAVVAWARPALAPHTPPGMVELPAATWHDVVSGRDHPGGPIAVGALLDGLPVAVLARV